MGTLDLSILIKAIDGVTAPVQKMTDGIDRMLRPLKKVGEAVNNLGKAAGLHKIGAALKKTGGAMADFGREAGKLALKIGAAAGAFGYLLKQTADTGDEFAKVSQRVGTSVAFLSQYAHGVELAGGTTEDLGKGMRNLSKNLVDASRGGSTSKFFFNALRISLKDTNGELKKADEVLLEVADRFSRMPDGPQKAAAAMQLFGRSGEALLPFLNQGAEALRKNREEAERLGLVWSEQDAKAAEEFNDSLTDLHGAFRGVIKQVATQLFPVLTPLIKRLTEWVVKNRELIAGKIREWLAKATAAVRDLWNALRSAWKIMEPFVKLIGPGNAALLALAGTIGGPLIASIVSLVASLATLSWALMSTPAGWIIAALAGIAAGFGLIIYGVTRSISMIKKFGITWGEAIKGSFALTLKYNPLSLILKFWNWLIEKITGFDLLGAVKRKLAAISPVLAKFFAEHFPEENPAARNTGPGLDQTRFFARQVANAARRPAAQGAAAAAARVAGRVHISISEDRVRVKGVSSSGPLDITAGLGSMTPGY